MSGSTFRSDWLGTDPDIGYYTLLDPQGLYSGDMPDIKHVDFTVDATG